MAIFTPAEIAEQIAAYKAAMLACASGKSYTIGDRSLTRADLPEIRSTLEWLDKQNQVSSNQGGPAFLTGRPAR